MNACLIVPTHNEAATVAEVVTRALDLVSGVDVLVVDDASNDGTVEIVAGLARNNPRLALMSRPAKLGLGDAYRAGYKRALKCGYDVVLQMDADLSHNPADLPRLIEMAGRSDVVIGSRYVQGGRVENWPWGRLLLSRAANAYVRTLLRLGVADATAGFRCYTRGALEQIDLASIGSEGYAFQVEMTWRARAAGLRIAEVPITFVERQHGQSKMSLSVVAEGLRSVAAWSVTRRRAERRQAEARTRARVAGTTTLLVATLVLLAGAVSSFGSRAASTQDAAATQAPGPGGIETTQPVDAPPATPSGVAPAPSGTPPSSGPDATPGSSLVELTGAGFALDCAGQLVELAPGEEVVVDCRLSPLGDWTGWLDASCEAPEGMVCEPVAPRLQASSPVVSVRIANHGHLRGGGPVVVRVAHGERISLDQIRVLEGLTG